MRGQGGEARPVATWGDFCAPVAGTNRRPGLFFCSEPRGQRKHLAKMRAGQGVDFVAASFSGAPLTLPLVWLLNL